MKWFVHDHAAERLIDRVDRSMPVSVALELLIRRVGQAKKFPQPRPDGSERWAVEVAGVNIVLIVKPDHRIRKRVVVTLWRRDEEPDEFDGVDEDEVLAAYQRATGATA